MKLGIGFKTDPGPREGHNQDTILAVIPEGRPDAALLIVADGMGGAKAGEQASREAVRVLQSYLLDQGLPAPEEAPARLLEAITAANASIHAKGLSSPDMEGMGCTIVVALVLDDTFWIASVGDSRAYLVRGSQIHQLTTDHTWVNARVREGLLTPEQAAKHSLRHVLDRALGTKSTVEIDVWPDEVLEEDDILVLCTDGLYNVLDRRVIAEIASSYPPQEAAEALVDRALRAPATDNVSVVILRASA
jgi:protein phosphatase